jgi:hypothetical protein
MPQEIKPVFEVWTNKNFFTGQTIESPSMDKKRVEDRNLATTTEFAKGLSKMFPVMSPVQIEHITRAYLGTLPIVGMSAAGSLFGEKATPQPEARMSETPLIGQMFQRKFGGADQDVAYTLANEIIQTKNSFNELKKTGSPEDIREFVTDHRAELSAAPLAKLYQTNMGRLRQQADIIRERANLSPQEKRQRLDQIDEARQQLSNQFGKNMKAVESRG